MRRFIKNFRVRSARPAIAVFCAVVVLAVCGAPSSAAGSLLETVAGFRGQTGRNPAGEKPDWKSLPRSVNLRPEIEELHVNFIQQGPRNSCAAFSTVSALELQLRRLGWNVDLSEQYVLWGASETGANLEKGLSLEDLHAALTKHGVCREEFMPYRRAEKMRDPSPEAREDAAKMPEIRLNPIVSAGRDYGFGDDEIFAVCKALSRLEPVCFSSRWSEVEKPADRGVVTEDGSMSENHMVMLIGYELDPENPSEGHFLLRNSWGLGWGDFGYGKMPFSFARKHAIDAQQFQFVWKQNERRSEPAAAGVAEDVPGPGRFAALWLSVAAIGAFVGFFIPFGLFGRQNRSAWGVLKFILRTAPLFAAFAVAVASAGMAVGNARSHVLLGLAACLVVGLVLYLRITMRHFNVGFGRVLLLLLAAGLIRDGVAWVGDRFIPFQWYRQWERVFATTPLRQRPMLFALDAGKRARLLSMRQAEPVAGGWDAARELAWLDQWEQDLKLEQSRMQSGLPPARAYFGRRVGVYQAQRRAFEQRFPGGGDPIVASGAPRRS